MFFQLPETQQQSLVDDVDSGQLRRSVRWFDPDEVAGETLYEFTGVAEVESALDGPLVKIESRYK